MARVIPLSLHMHSCRMTLFGAFRMAGSECLGRAELLTDRKDFESDVFRPAECVIRQAPFGRVATGKGLPTPIERIWGCQHRSSRRRGSRRCCVLYRIPWAELQQQRQGLRPCQLGACFPPRALPTPYEDGRGLMVSAGEVGPAVVNVEVRPAANLTLLTSSADA